MQPIYTQRLILRSWQESDLDDFVKMNQDPRVMEYFPSTLTPAETKALIERINVHFEKYGFGPYACAVRETKKFIGFVGLSHPPFEAHFTPCVEIGWRLAFEYWGKGYATEAAQALLKVGFENYNLDEIVSFTVPQNKRSRRIMEKLGMKYNAADDFRHPLIPLEHPLSQHVLYRLKKKEWLENNGLRI